MIARNPARIKNTPWIRYQREYRLTASRIASRNTSAAASNDSAISSSRLNPPATCMGCDQRAAKQWGAPRLLGLPSPPGSISLREVLGGGCFHDGVGAREGC